MSKGVYQLFDPFSVREEIARRGYDCAVWLDGDGFSITRAFKADGSSTAAFNERYDREPHLLVGVYSASVGLDWLASNMNYVKREQAA